MKRTLFTFSAIGALTLLAGCKTEPVDLGLYCEADAASTLAYSSALAYGVAMPPPQVEGTRVLKETDLFQLQIGDAEHLGLIATDASGALHHRVCKDALCSLDDAAAVLGSCPDQPQCQIVGAVSMRTFYPLYISDEAGGHVCNSRWAPPA